MNRHIITLYNLLLSSPDDGLELELYWLKKRGEKADIRPKNNNIKT